MMFPPIEEEFSERHQTGHGQMETDCDSESKSSCDSEDSVGGERVTWQSTIGETGAKESSTWQPEKSPQLVSLLKKTTNPEDWGKPPPWRQAESCTEISSTSLSSWLWMSQNFPSSSGLSFVEDQSPNERHFTWPSVSTFLGGDEKGGELQDQRGLFEPIMGGSNCDFGTSADSTISGHRHKPARGRQAPLSLTPLLMAHESEVEQFTDLLSCFDPWLESISPTESSTGPDIPQTRLSDQRRRSLSAHAQSRTDHGEQNVWEPSTAMEFTDGYRSGQVSSRPAQEQWLRECSSPTSPTAHAFRRPEAQLSQSVAVSFLRSGWANGSRARPDTEDDANDSASSDGTSRKPAVECREVRVTRVPLDRSNRDTIPPSLQLWEFLLHLLELKKHSDAVMWMSRQTGLFHIAKPDELAKEWGRYRALAAMNYEKMSRAMRYYYARNILDKTCGRMIYKYTDTVMAQVLDISREEEERDEEESVKPARKRKRTSRQQRKKD